MNMSPRCSAKLALGPAVIVLAGLMAIPLGVLAATPSEAALVFLKSRMGTAGLLDSFVEDRTDYSYTYDNAIAAIAFLSSGDRASAQRILDGFAGVVPAAGGGFLHRYRTTGAAAGG